MAKMTFTKNENDEYVCNAQVDSDFNIHIEREKEGALTIDVSTVSGLKYENKWSERAGKVFDKDFRASVYPKYLRIVSHTQPKDNACFITESEG